MRFKAMPIGVGAACYVVVLVALTLGATLLGVDPTEISNDSLLPPSGDHWLGTDELGRSVLAGLIIGIQISFSVGFSAALAATLLGIVIGGISGYYGGILDLAVMRTAEIFQVVPSFILAAMIVALAGPGLLPIIAVIVLLAWPQVARIMRSEVMRVKQLEFVDAVRCLGYREPYILAREVIPNAMAPTLAVGSLIVGQAILLEAALSFFGLGSPDLISWGRMLNSGQQFISSAWWLSVFPGLAILCSVLAFNLVGDAVGRALNPRSPGR
jgi:peptide/nickel transport system permease protein